MVVQIDPQRTLWPLCRGRAEVQSSLSSGSNLHQALPFRLHIPALLQIPCNTQKHHEKSIAGASQWNWSDLNASSFPPMRCWYSHSGDCPWPTILVEAADLDLWRWGCFRAELSHNLRCHLRSLRLVLLSLKQSWKQRAKSNSYQSNKLSVWLQENDQPWFLSPCVCPARQSSHIVFRCGPIPALAATSESLGAACRGNLTDPGLWEDCRAEACSFSGVCVWATFWLLGGVVGPELRRVTAVITLPMLYHIEKHHCSSILFNIIPFTASKLFKKCWTETYQQHNSKLPNGNTIAHAQRQHDAHNKRRMQQYLHITLWACLMILIAW